MAIDKTALIRYLVFNYRERITAGVLNNKVIKNLYAWCRSVGVHDFEFFIYTKRENAFLSDRLEKGIRLTSPFVLADP